MLHILVDVKTGDELVRESWEVNPLFQGWKHRPQRGHRLASNSLPNLPIYGKTEVSLWLQTSTSNEHDNRYLDTTSTLKNPKSQACEDPIVMTVVLQPSDLTDPDSLLTAMSQTSISSSAQPTPLPHPLLGSREQHERKRHTEEDNNIADGYEEAEEEDFQQPKLRLEIRDLQHPGAAKFLASVNAGTVTSTAVTNVQRLLYRSPTDTSTNMPPTRSVTVILRDMDGVAYTTGVSKSKSYLV